MNRSASTNSVASNSSTDTEATNPGPRSGAVRKRATPQSSKPPQLRDERPAIPSAVRAGRKTTGENTEDVHNNNNNAATPKHSKYDTTEDDNFAVSNRKEDSNEQSEDEKIFSPTSAAAFALSSLQHIGTSERPAARKRIQLHPELSQGADVHDSNADMHMQPTAHRHATLIRKQLFQEPASPLISRKKRAQMKKPETPVKDASSLPTSQSQSSPDKQPHIAPASTTTVIPPSTGMERQQHQQEEQYQFADAEANNQSAETSDNHDPEYDAMDPSAHWQNSAPDSVMGYPYQLNAHHGLYALPVNPVEYKPYTAATSGFGWNPPGDDTNEMRSPTSPPPRAPTVNESVLAGLATCATTMISPTTENMGDEDEREAALTAYSKAVNGPPINALLSFLAPKPYAVAQSGPIAYSRKKKSLGILAENFMKLYLPREAGSLVILDEAAGTLGVERRRIYDVVNILEALSIVSKKQKNTYTWNGTDGLNDFFGELQLKAILNYPDDARNYGFPVQAEKPHPTLKDNKSLARLSQEFLQIYLVGHETLSLPQASDKIQGITTVDELIAIGQQKTPSPPIAPYQLAWNSTEAKEKKAAAARGLKTKIRRLYDIANVFLSVGLLCKMEGSDPDNSRRPNFMWSYQLTPKEIYDLYQKNKKDRFASPGGRSRRSKAASSPVSKVTPRSKKRASPASTGKGRQKKAKILSPLLPAATSLEDAKDAVSAGKMSLPSATKKSPLKSSPRRSMQSTSARSQYRLPRTVTLDTPKASRNTATAGTV